MIFYLHSRLCSTKELKSIAQTICQRSGRIILSTKDNIQWVYRAEERMAQVMSYTGAKMVYSDHFANGAAVPVIDYQMGSLRDDFEFGAITMWDTQAFLQAVSEMDADYQYAAFYDLRLRVSRMGEIVHIPEYLYYEQENDTRKSGEKLFDYVNPANREVQIEMEACVTAHLRSLGALIDYHNLKSAGTPYPSGGGLVGASPTLSVIIPCRNRAATIETAVRSALSQRVRAPYSYNVIVVDDNSTDGTQEILEEIQKSLSAEGGPSAKRSFSEVVGLVILHQDPTWHGIGGNWNLAIHDPRCGQIAIQLDSDDAYADETTVQRFIDAFNEGDYAMVIGTYQIVDEHLQPVASQPLSPSASQPISPLIISHSEWTPENGMNNALRINGLGAPRAFRTDVLRTIDFPSTKYGEDYAVALRISREYKIGRIYDVVYLCRRWDHNSDANCSIEEMNRNNLYKDRLRTWELQARRKALTDSTDSAD